MLQVSDADIARAERLLLPGGCTFNEERRCFIKCMESRDVVACPGSGKTTALLAKLLILTSYMPFLNGRGVCVLTHTNVAIDEIKRRASGAADALFTHPNFFGTIQVFVNRFLAIPAYRNMYRQPVQAIDNDHFFAALRSRYQRGFILQGWLEPRGGVGTLGGYWFKPEDLTIGKDMDTDIPKLSRTTKTYEKIEELRHTVLREGFLSYNDAYSLALHHLTKIPAVAEAIQQRFAFVFIDEMQDTDDHQIRILDKLFNCDTVVLQRLGDPNQAIFDSNVKDQLWSPTQPILPFSDSLRYGKTIADVLDTVRIDRQLSLTPNPEQLSLPPHMLIFDAGRESEVLPAFANLIRGYKLHETKEPCFKAVGWVGKDKMDEGKVCLRCYHPEYQKTLSRKNRWFGSLISYTQAMEMSVRKDPQNGGALFEIALSGMVRALRIAGLNYPKTQRPFTAETLERYLKETNHGIKYTALRQSFAEWLLAFRQGKINVHQLRDAISAFLRTQFDVSEKAELENFLASDSADFETPEKACANTFVSDAGDVIEIGTVHSVKGETHTATLYLETFNYELDSERILPFCMGEYPATEAKKSRHRANLKVAHVAFSRPTHLLVFACCKEHVTDFEAKLEEAGWVVQHI